MANLEILDPPYSQRFVYGLHISRIYVLTNNNGWNIHF